MPRKISRYLFKEVIQHWIAMTLILMLIFLSTQFVHYLTGAAVGRYAAELLIKIMALQVPILLGLLIPVGFYGALLLAYGRLHAEREMMVFIASGLSPKQLLFITLKISLIVFAITALFSLWLSPLAGAKQKNLIEAAKTAPVIDTLLPGRFFQTPDKRYILFVDDISQNHEKLHNIFIAQKPNTSLSNEPKTEKWSIITAQSANQVYLNQARYLQINYGYRYQFNPGLKSLEQTQFQQYSFHLDSSKAPVANQDAQKMSTLKLWQEGINKPNIAAEWQWRISSPFSVFILAILGIPLSRVNPRQGRFASLFPAALIYVSYANLMFVCRAWIENGVLSPKIGVWWLQLLAFFVAAILFIVREQVPLPFKFKLLAKS